MICHGSCFSFQWMGLVLQMMACIDVRMHNKMAAKAINLFGRCKCGGGVVIVAWNDSMKEKCLRWSIDTVHIVFWWVWSRFLVVAVFSLLGVSVYGAKALLSEQSHSLTIHLVVFTSIQWCCLRPYFKENKNHSGVFIRTKLYTLYKKRKEKKGKHPYTPILTSTKNCTHTRSHTLKNKNKKNIYF